MMKKLCFTFLLGILISFLYSQQDLKSPEWQADLDFLQETIHNDYHFLFKKTTPEIFDTEVARLRKAIPNLQSHEIIVGLARIVSLFEYGHTSLGLSGWWERDAFNFTQMNYNLHIFSDGVFIQGTTTENKEALGAKVLKIEGVPIEEALAKVKPVFPSENDEFFEAYGTSYLGNAEVLHAQRITKKLQKEIRLTLEKEGRVFDHVFKPIKEKGFPGQYTYVKEGGDWLDARDNSSDPLYLKNLDRIYYDEYLPEHKTLYIRHSQIQDDELEDIPSFYNRVFQFVEENEVEKLILDVRLNGGGNNYKNKPIVTNIIKSKVNEPGRLFVIIGGQTFSACQNLVNELDNYTEAIFVGEPTGENINFFGDNRTLTLPNSEIPIRLSFAWWQDKPQWEGGPWLAPHLAIDMSFEEYATNQDPAVDKILNFQEENFILDPMSYLTELYQTGQAEKLQSEALRLINDPHYQFFEFEAEFNQLGYRLLNSGDTATALIVFQFITGLFPDSANAWDSLAEGFWKSGDKINATEYYNKAIAMDPEGEVGKNARMMLEKMSAEE